MDLQAIRADLEEDEGRVRHLYLCSRGHVTVAVGVRVFSVQEALALPLRPAEAIVSDYEAVRSAPAGLRASEYARVTVARMSDADIDALTETKIRSFAAELERKLPGFAGCPDPVQRALFNLGYNVGLEMYNASSEHYWPALGAAIAARDWRRCALHCHRKPPVSEARNKRTAGLFLAAA